jgi:signal transduction histidine kinase
VITNALRSLWAEPRAAAVPERLSRDWVLVGALMVTALLEGVFRDDVAWRPFVTIVAVGLAPVLLWRRTQPLACVMVAFGTAMALALASLAGGVPGVGLDTMIYLLVLVYALVRWGSGREIVIGLTVVLVAAVIGTVADYTGPAVVIGGFGILAAAAADGAAFRYRAESWRRALDQIRSQERVGLARELHDMVAHHVSAIAVQAQAGRTLAGQRPEAGCCATERRRSTPPSPALPTWRRSPAANRCRSSTWRCRVTWTNFRSRSTRRSTGWRKRR